MPKSSTSKTGSVLKVYQALLTQTSTDAPVATVLENGLGGTVVWTRGGAGEYSATLAGAFPANKVTPVSTIGNSTSDGIPAGFNAIKFVIGGRDSNDVYVLKTGAATVSADDILTGYHLEILVYP